MVHYQSLHSSSTYRKMSSNDATSNPFSSLLASSNAAPTQKDTTDMPKLTQPGEGNNVPKYSSKDLEDINNLIETVFLITMNTEVRARRPKQCVFLSDLAEASKNEPNCDVISKDNLDQAVFERLMCTEPEGAVIDTGSRPPSEGYADEADVIRYLIQCYIRVSQILSNRDQAHIDVLEACKNAIITNAQLGLTDPEIFMDQDLHAQLVETCKHYQTHSASVFVRQFIHATVDMYIVNSDDEAMTRVFRAILDMIVRTRMSNLQLEDARVDAALYLCDLYCSHPKLAQLFMEHHSVANANNGRLYEETAFGRLLSLSCIATQDRFSPTSTRQRPFFVKPSRQSKTEIDATEANVQQLLLHLTSSIYKLMRQVVKHNDTCRTLLLQWIADLLQANLGRGQMWAGQTRGLFAPMYVSDGFMFNLCCVLLMFAEPFCNLSTLTLPTSNARILKVSHTYCRATSLPAETKRQKQVYCRDLSKATCLVPQSDAGNTDAQQTTVDTPDTYNFITQIFYLTHDALTLGFHVIQEMFMQLNQELHRIQVAYEEIVAQGAQESEAGVQITAKMDAGMSYYLSIKAALTLSRFLDLSFSFNTTTAVYLCHVAAGRAKQQTLDHLNFPLAEVVPQELSLMPEFIAENVVDIMLFLKRFKISFYETQGESLSHLLCFVMTFMGSSSRMRNPHMRAHLAEGLEALMPGSSEFSAYHREQLFKEGSLAPHISETLLNVFVSIEMTGESVEFEMKFNYRRPMYTILKYLWTMDIHKDAMVALAHYAEEHIEDPNAPLFLRFINLLINDAIFLLDEALSYMKQIREQQTAKANGEWSSLPADQQRENESSLRQISMLARFHNMMGLETIEILELLTGRIVSLFTHSVMADRIAAMLNYFLLHLVGPKMKEIKVKQFSTYKFDPKALVQGIAQLYVNLGQDDAFCKAVCSDGRSYSKKLFENAKSVLTRVASSERTMAFLEIAAKIMAMGTQILEEDAALQDAPAEFLDPLMGTLMRDPVLLPSSGNIVDRSTIARHLLSDQTDPYNRSPLTMDMVQPDIKLQQHITEWLQQQSQHTKQQLQQQTREEVVDSGEQSSTADINLYDE